MRRRDFTINAIARRLATGELLDPLGRTRGSRAARPAHDEPDELPRRPAADRPRPAVRLAARPRAGRGHAAPDARVGAAGSSTSRPSGSAAASPRTGWASCRSSCSAPSLRRRCGSRATRASSCTCCPSSSRSIGFDQESRYHDLPLDEHMFRVVQAAADAGAPLAVRLAALLHDAGKPASSWRGSDGRLHFYAKPERGKRSHEEIGAELASRALARLRYPTRLRSQVRRIVARAHVRRPEAERRRPRRAGSSTATATSSPSTSSRTSAPTCWASGRRRTTTVGRELERLEGFRRTLTAGARAPAPARPARRRRRRPDRDRVRAGACARRHARAPALVRDRRPRPEHARVAARGGRAGAAQVIMRWDVPGPYEVAFSTRTGGVSDGPYASLNLGRMTGDDVERVDENRRRLCAEVGADADRLALNRQVHSTLVHRARAGARGEPGDGLWTDEPDLPIARADRRLPADRARARERRRAGGGRAPRGLARPARRHRRRGRRARSGGRARSRDRPGDRPVLLRGRAGGGGAVRRALRPKRAARPEPRPLDRRRARAPGRGRRAESSASTSAPPATRSSSSRTAGRASPAACRA